MLNLTFLKDLWDDAIAATLADDPLGLLRYRSNLLGADLRITNFGGGNTSSKFLLKDIFTGREAEVMAVKGSGGDIASIARSGFAVLYQDKLEQLVHAYRGEAFEDEMVDYYPQAAFGANKVAASIDTPLHALLPFKHVDHLHPDWAISLAASANGLEKMGEFNARFGRKLVWLPWQRPGFELGMMLRKVVNRNPGCDGIVLGGHGLFTWGRTQRECYVSSVTTIDRMGQFVASHRVGSKTFGGVAMPVSFSDRAAMAVEILPFLRGTLATTKRTIAYFTDNPDALEFANSVWGPELAKLGTSCPDHFLRTRIKPMFVRWDHRTEDVAALKTRITKSAAAYRLDYAAYYDACKEPSSPKLRDANPSVVIIPGVGLFAFGRNKKEARITGEFFINAIHVMEGACAMDDGAAPGALPQARFPEQSANFNSLRNYVALPLLEAFRIEYWALEEAKLQRMPPEQEFSRKIAFVAGGGNAIGRATVLELIRRGAHVAVADLDLAAAEATATDAAKLSSTETVLAVKLDITSRASIANALRETVAKFGGVDAIVNTAAIFSVPGVDGKLAEEKWAATFSINITANYLIADEARPIFNEQKLPVSLVLTSCANAVVPKFGSEAYDVSKSATSALLRELAVGMAPLVRVNGIAPATVVADSTMFPRDRVTSLLTKYKMAFSEEEDTEALRGKLAGFYALRTLTCDPIMPQDCAEAIIYLAGDKAGRTSGHIIPVDGGLPEAFLR